MPRNYPVPRTGPIDPTTGAANQVDGVLYPSTSTAVGTVNTQEWFNPGAKGIRLFVNVSNVGAAGTVAVALQNFDPASQTWMTMPPNPLIAAITTVSSNMITIYPGDLKSDSVNNIGGSLGIRWRLALTVAGNAVTFSVGGDYLDN